MNLRRSAPVLALSLALLGSAHAGPVEDGLEALEAGDAALALRYFKIAIKANPQDDAAWSGYERASKLAAGGADPGPGTSTPAPAPAPAAAGPAGPQGAIEAGAFARYLKGDRIFYSESFKAIMRGRRMTNKTSAKAQYDAKRLTQTRFYTRKKGGGIEVGATLFTPELHAYFACVQATDKKLSPEAAVQLWEKSAEQSFRLLEFYVLVENKTWKGGVHSNKREIDLSGINEQVFLEDDRGVRYQPYKTDLPSSITVKDSFAFNVWFPPFDKNGRAIWENSVNELRLVFDSVEGESSRIVFPFRKVMFQRLIQAENS